jgi:hypothetical protein
MSEAMKDMYKEAWGKLWFVFYATPTRRLNAGSDAMRDEGHKLWLVLNRLEDHNAVSFDYKTSKLTWEV